jgi:hypothetical protein
MASSAVLVASLLYFSLSFFGASARIRVSSDILKLSLKNFLAYILPQKHKYSQVKEKEKQNIILFFAKKY